MANDWKTIYGDDVQKTEPSPVTHPGYHAIVAVKRTLL